MHAVLPRAPIETGDPSTRLFSSDLVTMGRFWCSPRHPQFSTAGTIDQHTFAYPETAVWIAHDDGPRFFGNPARVSMYNPGQLYTRTACDDDGDRCTWFAVADSVARDVVGTRDQRAAASDRVFAYACGPATPAASLRARRLLRLVASGRVSDPFFVEEAVISLFSRTVAGVYDSQPSTGSGLTRRQHEIVETVAFELYRTCTENHSLSTLADTVDLSVFHLCRLFRRATGMTMHAYRHHLRMSRALDALGTPDVDLLGLAVDLGYCSHSHFTRMFRRQVGQVPSSVRQQLQM
jgi:AraC-like DNA-binding protein